MDIDILKTNLNLKNLDFIYIQKILGIPISIYIITYDSRNYKKFIPYRKFKITKVSEFKFLYSEKIKNLKLTPPINIKYYNHEIPNNSLIITRDLSGDLFVNKQIFLLNKEEV